jgi:hypothetical protein
VVAWWWNGGVVMYEKLSLVDRMDSYLKDLDAIKNYEKVKQQRDEAVKQCKEIKNKLKPIIENIIDVLGSPESHRYSQDALEIAGEQIIEKIDKLIKLEVEKRVNDDFKRRVEVESNLRADAKVKQVVDTEWPKYYRENIEPKVRELETKIKDNTLSVLKGPWTIQCYICGKRQNDTEINYSHGLQSLLINGYVDLKCDRFLISLSESPITSVMVNPHDIRIQLSDMIQDTLLRKLN